MLIQDAIFLSLGYPKKSMPLLKDAEEKRKSVGNTLTKQSFSPILQLMKREGYVTYDESNRFYSINEKKENFAHIQPERQEMISMLSKVYEILDTLTPIIKKTKKTRQLESAKKKLFVAYQQIILKLVNLQSKESYLLDSSMESKVIQKYLKKDILEYQKNIRQISKRLKNLDPHLAKTIHLATFSKL